jgi:hypothetical protein
VVNLCGSEDEAEPEPEPEPDKQAEGRLVLELLLRG